MSVHDMVPSWTSSHLVTLHFSPSHRFFPGTLLPPTYSDPDNPDHILGRSEVERRTDYIQPLYEQLGEQHPLLQQVCQCLHNIPACRPSAEELLHQLEAIRPQIERAYGSSQQVKVEMAKLQVAMTSVLRMRETEVGEKDGEIEQLRCDLQRIQEDKQRLQAEVEALDTQLQQQDEELHVRAAQIDRQQRELQILREDKRRLHTEVEANSDEIYRQQRELEMMRNRNSSNDEQVTALKSQLQQLQEEMDSRVVQVQQQLRDRNAEINELRRELRDQTAFREETEVAVQRPPVKLRPHLVHELKLKWRRLADMPYAMAYPNSVVVDTVVYVAAGGGGSREIHRYEPQTQRWIELPEYHCRYFTMAEVNHQLTVIGGVDRLTENTSNAVAVYSTSHGRWEKPYPPMNTPRSSPAVSTYHQHLVVAGGVDGWTDLATVEILDISTLHSQWFFATPLPMNCNRMSSAIINSELYLLGGTMGKQVLSVFLSALTQADNSPAQWRTLLDAPLKYSAAIAFHGSLLAMGGHHDEQCSSAIHVYNQEMKAWKKVEDLPTERAHCACCLLPSGDILVAGGKDEDGRTTRVDVAAAMD